MIKPSEGGNEKMQNEFRTARAAILNVVAFFDIFNYPMTAFEIWFYLGIKCSYADVLEWLKHIKLSKKNGFYYLPNRESAIEARQDKYNYTDKKFKKAKLLCRIFKFIPWIKMIAIANIIGANNLREGSDIDLFIITKKNRIWISRFFCVSLTKLLNLRPKPGQEKDTICLSFYKSEEDLNISNLMIDNLDIYFIYWLAGLQPIYDIDNSYENFISANSWIFNCLPNWQSAHITKRRIVKPMVGNTYSDIVDLLIGGLEKELKKFQLKILPRKMQKIINKDTRIVVNKSTIKLHIKDRRQKYRELHYKNYKKIKCSV